MSLTAGQLALMERVASMPGAPEIVWPNGPGADLPRFVMQASGGSQRTFGASRITEARPEIVVRVETSALTASDQPAYSWENDALVAALMARFPVGARFDGLTIIDAPLPRPALPVSGGVYAVPVLIRGFTSF